MVSVAKCETLRRRIKLAADDTKALVDPKSDWSVDSEAISNVILAFRHLEDASMRLGKAIQALDGGVSVYDKAQVPA